MRAHLDRIASALEAYNAHQWPQAAAPPPGVDLEPTSVSFVDDAVQEELMDIELGLTLARGGPPSEADVVEEYQRRRQ